MSTKSTIEYSEDFHLYIDWADDLSGPHGYLRIDNGLVKELYTRQHRGGLSITLRLPPGYIRSFARISRGCSGVGANLWIRRRWIGR